MNLMIAALTSQFSSLQLPSNPIVDAERQWHRIESAWIGICSDVSLTHAGKVIPATDYSASDGFATLALKKDRSITYSGTYTTLGTLQGEWTSKERIVRWNINGSKGRTQVKSYDQALRVLASKLFFENELAVMMTGLPQRGLNLTGFKQLERTGHSSLYELSLHNLRGLHVNSFLETDLLGRPLATWFDGGGDVSLRYSTKIKYYKIAYSQPLPPK